MPWHVPEKHRLADKFGTKDQPYGAFRIESPCPSRTIRTQLIMIASPGMDGEVDWEHVSVRAGKLIGKQVKNCTPTWFEMCFVKSLFWDPEDCVMQLHPRASDYVNVHEHVLHLWRPLKTEIPTPPKIAV